MPVVYPFSERNDGNKNAAIHNETMAPPIYIALLAPMVVTILIANNELNEPDKYTTATFIKPKLSKPRSYIIFAEIF